MSADDEKKTPQTPPNRWDKVEGGNWDKALTEAEQEEKNRADWLRRRMERAPKKS